jgi:hypothetical protein
LLSRQFAQARGMEQWLKSNGILPDETKEARTGVVPRGQGGSAPARRLTPAIKMSVPRLPAQ